MSRARTAGDAQGSDGLREDAIHRAHGVEARPAARDHRLSRRPLGERSHGRFLIKGDETVWIDGPLTTAARLGAICYLDEVVEARQDTVVVIHPLTDDRRLLPIEKTGDVVEAAPGFQLVISYNPGYQHAIKDLKPSTRQRFVTLEFDFPSAAAEARSSRTRAA